MRARRTVARWLLAGGALLGAAAAPLAGPSPAAARPAPAGRAAQVGAELTLLAQTATVAPGGRFEATVAAGGAAADSTLEVEVHGRVRSRSELAASAEGVGLRSVVHSSTTTLAELPSTAEGARRVAVSLDPTAEAAAPLTAAGAYPVRLTLRDPDGATVATLITHLLLEPDEADDLPPLAVAVVADLAMAPARQPDGRVELPRAGRAADLLAATAAHDVAVSVAVSPEVVEALLDTDDAEGQRLLEGLMAAGEDQPVLALPYAPTSPDALVAADLGAVLGIELDEGRRTLQDGLGTGPEAGTWWAASDLGPDGVALLARSGLERVVLPDSQVVDLDAATGGLTLAQPFAVGTGREDGDEGLPALAVDRALVERLTAEGSAALDVSRTLADLAMIWFERPGVARSTVLPLDLSVPPAVAGPLLAGVAGSRLFEAVDLDGAFAHADPLERRGRPVVAELDPEDREHIDGAVARDLPGARTILGSFAGLVGDDSPRLRPMVSHLLLASSIAGDAQDQRGHLDSARSVVGAVTSAVSTPPQERITLTAREGTVPLTIQNDSGGPVNVSVRLRSPRLDFPEGDVIPLRLEEATTRLNVAVEARASGSFPLDVEVTSPDGVLVLSTTDYSVQSTAVSGVGLFLSIGAALFLLVWWARHWSRTRRSAKLVATAPPAHLAGREEVGPGK